MIKFDVKMDTDDSTPYPACMWHTSLSLYLQVNVSLISPHLSSLPQEEMSHALATMGQVENAEVRKPKYGNGSTETEVQK